jgi:hypothetical protein
MTKWEKELIKVKLVIMIKKRRKKVLQINGYDEMPI